MVLRNGRVQFWPCCCDPTPSPCGPPCVLQVFRDFEQIGCTVTRDATCELCCHEGTAVGQSIFNEKEYWPIGGVPTLVCEYTEERWLDAAGLRVRRVRVSHVPEWCIPLNTDTTVPGNPRCDWRALIWLTRGRMFDIEVPCPPGSFPHEGFLRANCGSAAIDLRIFGDFGSGPVLRFHRTGSATFSSNLANCGGGAAVPPPGGEPEGGDSPGGSGGCAGCGHSAGPGSTPGQIDAMLAEGL